MHPQLEAERFISCKEFIDALDKCHHQEFYKRMFGVCNNEKDALSKCLKEASFQTKKAALAKSRSKRDSLEKKWRILEDEEAGDDKVVRILLQREIAKREGSTNSNNKPSEK
ncbi:Cmc2p KNAG_0B02410 [Huiozyma naganishii CBS 8797]|uniref:COX assembly mitochondrial protein n=1 Tax=Huiozyma naganishii (strain ATCC MYA-139 / BCRC 22969 / CBS 8797 / KCTC 17520 / NBRC 10181 / NCYC 3082 / Yp74L-3) TaxID=1071383 RepID=J7RGL2_HUIN7|nr:hypothetical protein KNAG_0B02410 [Kazachstania naganishii CBS 8797]CCK68683.1 hypothetical protein KNAG_0B02410 [Kazachstania naganishii CBS 8797]